MTSPNAPKSRFLQETGHLNQYEWATDVTTNKTAPVPVLEMWFKGKKTKHLPKNDLKICGLVNSCTLRIRKALKKWRHFEDPKKKTTASYRFMKTPPLGRVLGMLRAV